MTSFVADDDHIVHTTYCKDVGDNPVAYIASMPILDDKGKPALATPKDYVEMHAHLLRPDSSGSGGTGFSRHEGPSILRPCDMCIPGDQS